MVAQYIPRLRDLIKYPTVWGKADQFDQRSENIKKKSNHQIQKLA